jgi:phosphoribosylamine--glycine ligase
MKVFVVGNGGREHALCWKLAQSTQIEQIYATRPNAGMVPLVDAVDISPTDVPALVKFAKDERIDMVIPGPEAPLCAGIVDALTSEGIYAFGPTADCARLEGSKHFAKLVMERMGVPTAEYQAFSRAEDALEYVSTIDGPVVVKADGLASGKGVHICMNRTQAIDSVRQIMEERKYGDAGQSLVVEEFMVGRELSFIALVDGTTVVPLASSQDHKRLLDEDKGPNTGGMGAFSPSPALDDPLYDRIMHEVMYPTVQSIAEQGLTFRGFLYAGLMLTERGPRVLEFNVRMGDPETQPIMSRLKSDLAEVLWRARAHELPHELMWDDRASVCLVLASEGYPEKPIKGRVINGLEAAAEVEDSHVFHAGTSLNEAGEVITTGGRVLGVTALGDTLEDARQKAYEAASRIHFDGMQLRKDIGGRAY